MENLNKNSEKHSFLKSLGRILLLLIFMFGVIALAIYLSAVFDSPDLFKYIFGGVLASLVAGFGIKTRLNK